MNTIAKKSVNAGKFITNEQVSTLLSTYKQNRWVDNSDKIGKEDSLTVSVSIEELETLIERIKLHGGDGVRFHFAAYPENYAPQPEFSKNRMGKPDFSLSILSADRRMPSVAALRKAIQTCDPSIPLRLCIVGDSSVTFVEVSDFDPVAEKADEDGQD